jgi:hypothetical protein
VAGQHWTGLCSFSSSRTSPSRSCKTSHFALIIRRSCRTAMDMTQLHDTHSRTRVQSCTTTITPSCLCLPPTGGGGAATQKCAMRINLSTAAGGYYDVVAASHCAQAHRHTALIMHASANKPLLTDIMITCMQSSCVCRIDSQAVLPASFFPETAKELLASWVDDFHDPFMSKGKSPEWWFTSFVTCELCLQVQGRTAHAPVLSCSL